MMEYGDFESEDFDSEYQLDLEIENLNQAQQWQVILEQERFDFETEKMLDDIERAANMNEVLNK